MSSTTPPTVVDLRRPELAGLRAAVTIRQEDLLETLLTHPSLAPVTPALVQAGFDWGQIVQILGPYIGALIGQVLKPKPPKPPEPVVVPDVPPVVVAPPPPVVVAPALIHHIVSGRGRITGLMEGGPLGKRWGGQDLKNVLGGVGNGPHDTRLEFDFTPTFEDGHVGQPSAPGALADPYFLLTPLCPRSSEDSPDGPMQVVRLRFDYEGDGSADLAMEYAQNGCTPRIRIKTGGAGMGLLSNLRFEYAGGATPVEGVDVIHIGRGA